MAAHQVEADGEEDEDGGGEHGRRHAQVQSEGKNEVGGSFPATFGKQGILSSICGME